MGKHLHDGAGKQRSFASVFVLFCICTKLFSLFIFNPTTYSWKAACHTQDEKIGPCNAGVPVLYFFT